MASSVKSKLKAFHDRTSFTEVSLPQCKGSITLNFDYYTRNFADISLSEVESIIKEYEKAKIPKVGSFSEVRTRKIPKNIETPEQAFETGLFTIRQFTRKWGNPREKYEKWYWSDVFKAPDPNKIISKLKVEGVYLFTWCDGGPTYYKIGRSNNLYDRMASWKKTMPDPDCVKFIRLRTPRRNGYYGAVGDAERDILLASRDFLITGEWGRDDIGRHRTYIEEIKRELDIKYLTKKPIVRELTPAELVRYGVDK